MLTLNTYFASVLIARQDNGQELQQKSAPVYSSFLDMCRCERAARYALITPLDGSGPQLGV